MQIAQMGSTVSEILTLAALAAIDAIEAKKHVEPAVLKKAKIG